MSLANRLVYTKDMSQEEWLEWRRKGIGGSEAAAICGLNKYTSPLAVYLDKLGELPPLEDNPKMKAGRMLEPLIADWFEEETGYRVMQQHSIFQHPDHPFMLANIDRWIIGENAGLEIKNTSEFNRKDWFDGQEEVIPVAYQIQANHYMAILGADRWFVAVLIGGWDFQWRVIERDERLIESLITIERNFWEQHVLKEVPPEVTAKDTDYLNQLYPESEPESRIDLSESHYDMIKELLDSKESLDYAKEHHEEARNKVKSTMGDNEIAYWQGERMFSWKTDKRGRRTFRILGGM